MSRGTEQSVPLTNLEIIEARNSGVPRRVNLNASLSAEALHHIHHCSYVDGIDITALNHSCRNVSIPNTHRERRLQSAIRYACSLVKSNDANAQTAAFEDFLTSFKSTASDLDPAATNALEHLHLEEDGLSDEYDFMEDVEDGKAGRRKPGQYPDPKRKYMDMLQQVADRKLSEVTIDLDDLENVSGGGKCRHFCAKQANF